MLLARVIGPCPKCGTPNTYGNVNVLGNFLNRGCTACNGSSHLPLPEVDKSIIYLDQFFFSHAFRDSESDFAAAISLITELAHHQLAVVPFSPTHKTETHQWPNEKMKALWEFIRITSRGHEFLPSYHVRHQQIARAFRAFRANKPIDVPVPPSDVSHDNLSDWEDYIWIDVSFDREDPELVRASKVKTVEALIALFASWRNQPSKFDEDIEAEVNASAQNYIKAFGQLLIKVGTGDTGALTDSPIDSMVVEDMFRQSKSIEYPFDQLKIISEFFRSEYFRHVPYERISNGILAVLKHRVKMGQFANPDKARDALSGFTFDLDFVSAYLPYCDAMFLDQAMYDMVSDKRLALQETFGTQLFSRSNWDDFLNFLASIERELSPEVRRAVGWVYPESSGAQRPNPSLPPHNGRQACQTAAGKISSDR